MVEAQMTDANERRALSDELAHYNMRVAQPDDPPLFTRAPKPSMLPLHWKAADIERMLHAIGANLKLESGGQRRTLRLTNPGLPYGTTTTLWCSIQYILPGEVATAHRHTATALRFIMSGEGAHTTVDGERYPMRKGDLVLTPSLSWHDHEHLGDEPMVWLDVLDISLVRALDATMFEPGDTELQPVADVPERSMLEYGSGLMRPLRPLRKPPLAAVPVYAWRRAIEVLEDAASLDPDPYHDTAFEYRDPVGGGAALSTIGTILQRLRPGARCRPHRNTGTSVFHVVRGRGRIDFDDQAFDWGPGDFVSIPSWCRHALSNASASDDAILFHVNDRPALEKLGLFHETFD